LQAVENTQQVLSILRDGSLSNVSGLLQPSNSFGIGGIGSDLSRFGEQRTRYIASTLEEFGGKCSVSAESFRKALLSSSLRIDEEQLALILITVLPGEKRGEMQAWNYDVVSEVLQQECKGLNWAMVVKLLDNPRLTIRSETDFQVLVQLFVRVSGSSIPPAGLLHGLWSNIRAQFTLLALLSGAPRTIIDFSPFISQDQIIPGENIPVPANLCWLCHPFYARLLDIANGGLTIEVLEVIMKAAANYPEYVFTSLAVVQQPGVVRLEVLQRLLPLFTGLPGSRPSSHAVMRKLFATNTDLLFRLCYIAFKKATKAAEIVMTESIVKNLGTQYFRRLEADTSLEDLIGYWCVKSDRQELNLEEKLSASVDSKNVRFLVTYAKFHGDNLRSRAISQQSDGVMSMDSFTLIIRAIQQFPSTVSSDELKSLIAQFNQYQQSIQQFQPNSAFTAGRSGDADNALESRPTGPESEEVEALANAYFQKIYTTDISIQDVIQLLRQFKTSSEKKEQELFRCMVHNLFDEYRFFHKYPEKELQITARLFGALVQHQLISSITLGIALRYVLEALRKDPDLGDGNDKMFRFGQIALEQFKSRLGEWPQYCSHLIQIPHLSRHNTELFQEAQRALSNPQPSTGNATGTQAYEQSGALPAGYSGYNVNLNTGSTSTASAVGLPASSSIATAFPTSTSMSSLTGQLANVTLGSTSLSEQSSKPGGLPFNISASEFTPANAINETQVPSRETEKDRMMKVNVAVEEGAIPSDSVRDNVHFIINNVAKSNIEAKSQELKDLLKLEHFAWFANYLVEKRVSSQPNLHPLYLTMLDIIDSSELNKYIVDSTLHNVTKFLSSANITSSTSERSILRHFGMWLGQMTLAKNRPLLQRKINLKQLIIWGYETGHLIAVCPFVAKVVEGVKESKVFRPPNPWLMAILGVMRELFEVEDLKLNIKFEVQVLCKSISVKLEDIPKSNLLQNCRTPVKDQKNPDFNFKPSQSQQQLQNLPPSGVSSPAVSAMAESKAAAQAKQPSENAAATVPVPPVVPTADDALGQALQQLLNGVVVNSSLTYFSTNPTQRRVVAAAVERGIREIYPSAVERSVALATTTTKQLILKDFSHDGNDSSLQKAAHTMVSSLAGNLSLAICKEPLRIAIGNHLRTLLVPSISDQSLIEQIVSVCANDNIELGSILIEKASIEKSIREIDESLAEAYANRKRAREAGSSVFVDESVSQLPSRLPAEIQDILKPSTLGAAQLQLYESFAKLSALFSSQAAADSGKSQAQQPLQGNVPLLSMTQAIEAYQLIYSRLDQALRAVPLQSQGREVTLAMLGDHEITQLIKDLVLVTQRTISGVRNETAMTFSESIFNKLFETSGTSPLRLEVFVTILDAVREACGGSKVFNPDIFAWLGKYSSSVSDEFSRRLYRHILLLLIRAKLIKPQDLDSYLMMQMEGGANIFWLELALVFIKQSVSEMLCSVYDFAQCIEAIQQIRPTNVNVRKSLQKWILDMKALATTASATSASSAAVAAPAAATPSTVSNAKEVAMKQQVAALLEKWLAIWSNINDQLFSQYLQLLHQLGVFRTEESADKFFRLALEVCVEASLKSSETNATMNYMFMDGLSKLFTLLIRVADKESSADPLAPRASLALLNRMLGVIAKLIVEDHDTKKNSKTIFDQRPFYRILSNMSQDLGVPTDDRQELAASLLPLVGAHAQCYLLLQPSIVPGFAYSWLLLISKRTFMPYLVRNQKGWQTMHKLLGSLLSFLQPYLKLGITLECVKRLYKGMLRILLVLLHDFPEFLCDFHLSLCEMIPLNCVQLRNLVLSAFPRTMRLPDPFTPNLRLDNLPEALQAPRILVDYQSSIGPLRAAVDNFVATGQPADLLTSLAGTVSASLASSSSLCTATILHLATVSIAQPAKNVGLEFLKALVHTCEGEQRYTVLNIVANQLRYPNSHTSYFSTAVLSLFAETESDPVQEQITRVLFERLIAHRPHPWGLLITFIELIKNPKYGFWRKQFTRSNPDIEKVFESMARSCLGASASAVIKQGQQNV
jgi:CCR4-NOT transcription complex subunit 1